MSIPNCDPLNTIYQIELDRARTHQAVLKIKFIYTDEGSYLIFVLKNDPTRELYLTTRRDRTRPKVWVDSNRLLADLQKDFPGLIFEANGNAIPPPEPTARPEA